MKKGAKSPFAKKMAKGLSIVFVAVVAFLCASYAAIIAFVPDPMTLINSRTPVRTWIDSKGRIVYYERRYEYEWRLNVPLCQISKTAIGVMLLAEDARFYQHCGIDFAALARAFFQNIFSGRIISGASTISMQLAGMEYKNGRRTYLQKVMQIAKTIKLEHLYTKDEILEAYFNNIPFGGNIYGIEAASRFYFGMNAKELGLQEAIILSGIPQRPNRFRPDRHPESTKKRQRLIIDRLVRANAISAEEGEEIYAKHIRYRDFSMRASFEELGNPKEYTHILGDESIIVKEDGNDIYISIDKELTERLRTLLKKHIVRLHTVSDAAAVLLDAKNGKIISYVGTLDFDNPKDGQYDAAKAVRSAGSALKPFIYHEAILGGLITASSVLEDSQFRRGLYTPENYSKAFSGLITATQSLSTSLNIPAIKLLSKLGVERVETRFCSLGLTKPGKVRDNGLSLALGTQGYRLADITRAYRALVPGIWEDREEGARIMISEMLRSVQIEGTTHKISWKTGTSNNNCDAWAFGYTEDFILGVWFGNKDGSRSKELIGAEVAAPALAEIINYLYAYKEGPLWKSSDKYYSKVELCKITGHLATDECTEKYTGEILKDIPLMRCSGNHKRQDRITILEPKPQTYFCQEGTQLVTLDLCATEKATWFVDSVMVTAKRVNLPVGRHTIVAEPIDMTKESAEMEIIVMDSEQ